MFESRRRTEAGSLPFWLPASVGVHAFLVVAVPLYSSPNQPSSPEVVWISEVTPSHSAHPVSPNHKGALAVPQGKPTLAALGEEDFRTSVAEKTVQASGAGAVADNSSDIAPHPGERTGPTPRISTGQPSGSSETSLLHATELSVPDNNATFGEQDRVEVPGLSVTRHRDWQFGSFEDNKLTYTDPNSPIKVTVRESSSAGFAEQNFMRNDDSTGPFGLSASDWGADSAARSQRVDWTLLDAKNFGVTAFSYSSEVGQAFETLGGGKKEFEKAGTSVMKVGGQVRIGAFGFGLAQASITDMAAGGTYFRSIDANPTLQQEASASVNLPQLVSGKASKFLPALWMSSNISQAPTVGQATSQTVTASLGGTWTWNMGYASLGYWNYHSNNSSGFGSTWSGRGFDANVGAYRSSFGIDAGLSYGKSEDAAPSWQSAGALYNSYASVSYKPDKLPGISLTVAAGNYDRNAMTYGVALSNSYAIKSNGDYVSLTAGLDLTSWFWGSEDAESGAGPEQRPSVKMFYRYSDNLYIDGSVNATKDVDSLVAMSIQRRF